MSRKPVFALLTTDPELQALGMTSDTVKGSSPTTSPEIRPFAILKWGEEQPFIGSIHEKELQMWVYDEPGSYTLINSILLRARTLLVDEAVDVVVDGERFSTARWQGTSPDLYDDIYKCITRYASFAIV